jgi:hypothetical protein
MLVCWSSRVVGVGAFVATLAGCNAGDLATEDNADAAGSTGDPSGSGEGDTDGPPPESSTDPSDGDTTGLTGTAGETGATSMNDPDTGDTDGAACDLDCGNGTCVEGATNELECACDDGFAFNGATCVECVAPPAAVDLSMSTVSLDLTIDGAVPPVSAIEYGDIYLRNRGTGDIVALGDTRAQQLSGSVLAGVYDVFYSRRAGASVVPANQGARIATLDASSNVEQPLDLQTVVIGGAFSFDGVAAPQQATDHGRVWLRDAATGDEILLGTTSVGEYSAVVLPREYELHYEALTSGGTAPRNSGWFGTLQAQDSEIASNIDIPTTTVSGSFNFDGAPAPANEIENGRVLLRNGDQVVSLGETRYGTYEARVLPGSYEVVYEGLTGADVAPANTRAIVSTIYAQKNRPLEHHVDIPTIVIAGDITFNGAPAPADPTDDGFVVLRHPAGDEVVLGLTSTGAYSRRVIAGSYEMYYVQDTSRQNAPRNTNARLKDIVAEAGVVGDVDIPSVAVSGAITLAGATPPTSDYEDGHVFLRNLDTGDSVLLGNTRDGGYAAPVVPGQYEIVYVADDAAGPLPINTGAVIGDASIVQGEPVDLAIDVPTLVLTGGVTVDGGAAPMTAVDIGNLFLVDAHTKDQLWLGNTFQGQYAQVITPGDYLVYYRVAASTGLVPQNANANLGCWHLQ